MNPDFLTAVYSEYDDSARLRAWVAHYEEKGCGYWKAKAIGRKRWERKGGWPPKSA